MAVDAETTAYMAWGLAHHLTGASAVHVPERKLVVYKYRRFSCEIRERQGMYQLANASPCQQRGWDDVRPAMSNLFDGMDEMKVTLVGYTDNKWGWVTAFPFLTGTSVQSDKLVYQPGCRRRRK
jgi:hypothetical protein